METFPYLKPIRSIETNFHRFQSPPDLGAAWVSAVVQEDDDHRPRYISRAFGAEVEVGGQGGQFYDELDLGSMSGSRGYRRPGSSRRSNALNVTCFTCGVYGTLWYGRHGGRTRWDAAQPRLGHAEVAREWRVKFVQSENSVEGGRTNSRLQSDKDGERVSELKRENGRAEIVQASDELARPETDGEHEDPLETANFETLFALKELKQFEELFAHWERMIRTPGSLSLRSHTLVLMELSKNGRLSEAETVLSHMTDLKPVERGKAVNSYVRGCLKFDAVVQASECLLVELDGGTSVSRNLCSRTLNSLVRQGEAEPSANCALKLSAEGLLNQHGFVTVLALLARKGDFSNVYRLAAEAERHDHLRATRSSTTSVLLNALDMLPFYEFRQVRDTLEKCGFECAEDVYRQLISVSTKDGKNNLAFMLYGEVLAKGLKPSVEIYVALIQACGKVRNLNMAFEVHEQMTLCGIKPNLATFNALANSCRHAGDVDRTLQVFDMMAYSEVRPDVVTYSFLVDAYGRTGRVEDAFATVDEMIGNGVEPSEVTFTHLISAAVRAGHIDASFKVLDIMEQRGIQPNVFTYSSLVHGLIKRGELSRAFEMLEQMRSNAVRPTWVTYASLLKACSRLYDANTTAIALQMLESDFQNFDRSSLRQLREFCRVEASPLSQRLMAKIDDLLNARSGASA